MMENREWTFVDKSSWGNGAWAQEPDKVQFTDTETGLPCLMVRHPRLGHWCGYVGIPHTHPLYEKNAGDIEDVECHGGLTYSDFCTGEELGVCHVVSAGEDDKVWWIGFDCAHYADKSPGLLADLKPYRFHGADYSIMDDTRYWSVPEVKAECSRLAAQVHALA